MAPMAIEVIPAILPKTLTDLEMQLEKLRGTSGVLQIDLVDTNILAGQEAIPLWEEFDFEIDSMLVDPAAEISNFIALGASRIVVHADAHSARQALESVQHLRDGSFATEIGVALRVTDGPEALQMFAGLYDYVQVMGIERVGSQGQPFDERAVLLVESLHAQDENLTIQVDGGIELTEVERLVRAGARRLVVGHAIVRAEEPLKALSAFIDKANSL